MPGAEVQANAIETVLRGLPLRSARRLGRPALIVLLGLRAPLASLRFGPIATIALRCALAAAVLVAVQLAFHNGRVVSFVYPLAALVLSTAGALSVHLMTTAFERERVRDLFSRFVPENVVDEVLAQRRRRAAPRRRAARGDRDVHRPARLHLVRRNARPRIA